MVKLLLTPEETAHALGISRTNVYAMLKRHEIQSIVIGKSRRIPVAALNEYVDRARETELRNRDW